MSHEFWSNSPWTSPEVVARLSTSRPNAELMNFAAKEIQKRPRARLLDIGCGAGCNAVPLAQMGWDVLGTDLSEPMLEAATRRAQDGALTKRLRFEHASMEKLPVEDHSFDFIVAHGIWNLARSATEFRQALQDAARAARDGAALFVYTFSRSTLEPDATPVAAESFVFTQFSGNPQCFLTKNQLIEELGGVGFRQASGTDIVEYGKTDKKPAIYEGIFRKRQREIPTNS
jgi:2-polyprenyl-3-methyl-5-hydroxy-6-metoxy-1,4-benzoquinol methylase